MQRDLAQREKRNLVQRAIDDIRAILALHNRRQPASAIHNQGNEPIGRYQAEYFIRRAKNMGTEPV